MMNRVITVTLIHIVLRDQFAVLTMEVMGFASSVVDLALSAIAMICQISMEK